MCVLLAVLSCDQNTRLETVDQLPVYREPRLFINNHTNDTRGCSGLLSSARNSNYKLENITCGTKDLKLRSSGQFIMTEGDADYWRVIVEKQKEDGLNWMIIADKELRYTGEEIEAYRDDEWRVTLDAEEVK